MVVSRMRPSAPDSGGGSCRTFDQYANLLVEHIVERHILFEDGVNVNWTIERASCTA